MSKAGVEMKDMGQAAAAAAAPVAAANAVPGYTRAQHIQALAPLNQAIANLGAARGNLDRLAASARGIHPKLHPNFWKQGSKKHHRRAIDKINDMDSYAYNRLENGLSGITTDLKAAHTAIPTAIDAVRTAHENLRRQHPALAEKSGKTGAQTRSFEGLLGPVSLGNYHGKKHTHPGNGSIVKGISRGEDYGPPNAAPHHRLFGGRKTRKHRRKHRRKHKRKTRKHKRKHKTKKRKHHRRKHKKKTRRR